MFKPDNKKITSPHYIGLRPTDAEFIMIKTAADNSGLSRGQFCLQAIKYAIDNMDPSTINKAKGEDK